MAGNCFLIRYAGGWAERKSNSSISTYGRHEALLSLGSVTSLAEANRVADAQLAEFATPREQTDILIEPRWNAEAPYLGFGVGDTITVQGEDHRVLAFAVTEDQATDRVIFVPTLNDNVVLNAQERMSQALQKMIRGTLGGRSKAAQPYVPVYFPRPAGQGGGAVFLETFPNDGDLDVTPEDLTWFAESNLAVTGDECGVSVLGNAQAEHDADTDMYVQCDVTSMPSSGAVFLVGRANSVTTPLDDEGDYLFVFEDTGNTYVEIGNWTGGVYASDTVLSSPVATWKLELDGTTATAYRNGVQVLQGSITSGAVGTRAGFQLGETGTQIDNFEFGDL